MIVMKFGGAVLRNEAGFRCMGKILSKAETPVLVVVSAFASATRDLEGAARLAQKGLHEEAAEGIEKMIRVHTELVHALFADGAFEDATNLDSALTSFIDEARVQLLDLITGVTITRQLTLRTLDRILSYGEFLAAHIARHVLQSEGLDVVGVDAGHIIVTTNEHGSAVPLVEKTRVHVEHELRPLFAQHRCVLIQGFVGKTEDGVTSTMGKESSNLTASLLGGMLGAEEIVIWTDVEGIRSADPAVCEVTQLRPHMSYTQARAAARNGLKLLYPTMIDPAERARIPLRIACAYKPDGESTVIDGVRHDCQPIVVVSPLASDARGNDTMSAVSTLFARPQAWLQCAASIALQMNDSDALDVMVQHGDVAMVMHVPHERATSVAQRFHNDLMLANTSS